MIILLHFKAGIASLKLKASFYFSKQKGRLTHDAFSFFSSLSPSRYNKCVLADTSLRTSDGPLVKWERWSTYRAVLVCVLSSLVKAVCRQTFYELQNQAHSRVFQPPPNLSPSLYPKPHCWKMAEASRPSLESENVSHSVLSNSLRPDGLQCPWNSPSKNTGVGCHFLLQGMFPTQVSHIAGRFFTV